MGIGGSKSLNAATQLRKGAAGNLETALTQYINAVKPLVKNNVNANITNVLKTTAFKAANGNPTSNTLLNKVNKAITALVKNSAAGLSAAAKANEAKAAATTEAAAAKARADANAAAASLKMAAKKANQLNAILTEVFKDVNIGNANAVRAAYTIRRGKNKLNANILLNKSRARVNQRLRGIVIPPKYQAYWNILKPAGAPPPPPGGRSPRNQANLTTALQTLANSTARIANANNNASYAALSPANLQTLNGAIKNSVATITRINNTAFNAAIKTKANKIAAKLAILLAPGAPPPPGPAAQFNRAALNAALAAIVATATTDHGVAANNSAKTAVRNRAIAAIKTAARNAGIANSKINANASVMRNVAKIQALNP
jgi:hypothetical protein